MVRDQDTADRPLRVEPGPLLRAVPGLNLYRDEDPFRSPHLREYRDWIDVLEVALMWTGAFPEPHTFGLRAWVLRPGGIAAVTVPAWLPERICWRLSDDHHDAPGGHVRIFIRRELQTKLAAAGLTAGGHHHAHALHSPYWWLTSAVSGHREDYPLIRAYRLTLAVAAPYR